MLPYHGSPLTPESAAAQVYAGRHAMVSFANPEQIALIAEVCQSFTLDNGAFGAWKSGRPITDWSAYYAWVEQWMHHPAFDWFLIPDVIDGSESQNDALIWECPIPRNAVPIWHLHESLDRLSELCTVFPRVALGSSGDYAEIGTPQWWKRMSEAMGAICDDRGRPRSKIHGLRMLDPKVFTCFPFASADSTNCARNVGYDVRWTGAYAPAGKAARGIVIAGRVEAFQSAPIWLPQPQQEEFRLGNMAVGDE